MQMQDAPANDDESKDPPDVDAPVIASENAPVSQLARLPRNSPGARTHGHDRAQRMEEPATST